MQPKPDQDRKRAYWNRKDAYRKKYGKEDGDKKLKDAAKHARSFR